VDGLNSELHVFVFTPASAPIALRSALWADDCETLIDRHPGCRVERYSRSDNLGLVVLGHGPVRGWVRAAGCSKYPAVRLYRMLNASIFRIGIKQETRIACCAPPGRSDSHPACSGDIVVNQASRAIATIGADLLLSRARLAGADQMADRAVADPNRQAPQPHAPPPAVCLHPLGSRRLETRYIGWVAIRQCVAVGRCGSPV
jgi:hypothetical protein